MFVSAAARQEPERFRTVRNLPEEFWTARPELERVRQAAHARARSADAVLGAVLGVCGHADPTDADDRHRRREPACLNVLLGLVGISGANKTSSAAARDLVPIVRSDIVADVPLGSGDGVVELFFETVTEDDGNGKKIRVQRRTKIAALLAILNGRTNVNAEDWRLAEMILDTSDRVRTWVLERNATMENNLDDARTRAAVKRQRIAASTLDRDAHERAVVAGARAMARLAHRRNGEFVSTREASSGDPGTSPAYATRINRVSRGTTTPSERTFCSPAPDHVAAR